MIIYRPGGSRSVVTDVHANERTHVMIDYTRRKINYTHPGRTAAPAPVAAPVRRTVVLRAGESMVIGRVTS